jgi:hypothetical protein
MQAIEFGSVIEDKSMPLPKIGGLRTGQPVRVVVLFDAIPDGVVAARPTAEDLAKIESDTPAMFRNRLATLKPHPEALGDLSSSPWDESTWARKRENL